MEGGPFYGVEFDALYNPRTGSHVTASSASCTAQQDPLTFKIPCVLNYDPTLRVTTELRTSEGGSKRTMKKKSEEADGRRKEKEASSSQVKKSHEKENKKKVRGHHSQVTKTGGSQWTRMKWDVNKGAPPSTHAVEYGEELYMASVNDVLKSKKEDAKGQSSLSVQEGVVDVSCKDLGVPAFNSSVGRSSALSRAVETFRDLPDEVERMFRADRRFDLLLNAQASKALNVPLRGQVYRDLVSVEGVPEEVSKSVRNAISDALHNCRPVPKAVDPAPSLLDWEKPTFSRMKPSGLPPIVPPVRPEVMAPASPPIILPGHQLHEASITFQAMGERFS